MPIEPSAFIGPRVHAILTAVGLLLAGCDDGATRVCELDRLGCSEPDPHFPIRDDCGLSEPLAVELGEGEETFHALVGGSKPTLYFGPQGGQHVFVAFRAPNPASHLNDRFRVTLWMAQGPDCAAGPPLGRVPRSCDRQLGVRQIILGPDTGGLHVASDGAVVETGLLLLLQYPDDPTQHTVMAVELEDTCGRKASSSIAFTDWPTAL